MFTIGLPGFLLALEPNRERIEGHFIRNVLLKALPAGLTDVLAVGALVVCGQALSLPKEGIATASTMLLAVVGFMILGKISYPFNRMKWGILALNLFCLAFSGLFLGKLFAISAMSEICILLMVVFGFAAESLFRFLSMAASLMHTAPRLPEALRPMGSKIPPSAAPSGRDWSWLIAMTSAFRATLSSSFQISRLCCLSTPAKGSSSR